MYLKHIVAGAVAGALLMLLVGSGLAAAQAARTADGKPDLSGVYNTATLTPLERPEFFGDKLYLTPQEATAMEKQAKAFLSANDGQSDPNREAPPSGGDGSAGAAGNVGGYNSFWIDNGDSVFEIDGKIRTSIISQPENGRLPALTPLGMKNRSFIATLMRTNSGTAWWLDQEGPGPYDNPEARPLGERCLLGFGSVSGPPMLPVLYNNFKRIVQTPTHVMILVEMNHDARIIRLSSEHQPDNVRSWMGDSIGWWEGDTLVVDTTNFKERSGLYLYGATEQLHVVERFERMDDKTLRYSFTVDDPGAWEAPWSGSYPWPASDDQVFEYACHEGNYALGNIMRGARILEADIEQGGGR
ncbi:MAG: hypothetical protein O3A63_02320 [Proteobacteria bacterium]|nr:hypothetical protein [Pseudomonadota bacterium]